MQLIITIGKIVVSQETPFPDPLEKVLQGLFVTNFSIHITCM